MDGRRPSSVRTAAARPGRALPAASHPDDPADGSSHAVLPASNADDRLRSALETVRLVAAPTTLLTGLLFYFGWVFTKARAGYFGVDPSVLGFSTQDYLLRSADAVFIPLSAVLIVGLAVVWAHATLWRRIHLEPRPDALRFVVPLLVATGLVLFITGLAAVPGFFKVRALRLGLGVGAGLLSYAGVVRRKLSGVSQTGIVPSWLSSVSVTLVGLLTVVTLFAAVGDWAQALGRDRGVQLAEDVAKLPGVVVYSKERLQIPGVTPAKVAEADSAYRFRYSGLKLLVRSGGNYFLISAHWSWPKWPTVVLPDTKDLRFDFVPPPK
jgi:hypothetical protein